MSSIEFNYLNYHFGSIIIYRWIWTSLRSEFFRYVTKRKDSNRAEKRVGYRIKRMVRSWVYPITGPWHNCSTIVLRQLAHVQSRTLKRKAIISAKSLLQVFFSNSCLYWKINVKSSFSPEFLTYKFTWIIFYCTILNDRNEQVWLLVIVLYLHVKWIIIYFLLIEINFISQKIL